MIYLRDSEGHITKVLSNGSDVTERRKAEDALMASEERFRTVANFTYDWEYWIGPDGKYIYVSPSCFRITGYGADEFITDHDLLAKITHPADRVSLIEHFQRELEESGKQLREHPYYDFRIISRQGEQRWISHVCQPVFGQNGEWLGRRGSNRDITEQKLAAEQLSESQKMLQLVLDTVPGRVFWKDRNSVYLGCNRNFALDAGLDLPGEIVGKTDFDMPWTQQAELYRLDDQEVIQSGQPKLNYEEPQSSPTGKLLWLETSKIPLRDKNGRIVGVLGSYEDITERKMAETALQESEVRYRRLIETMSEGMAMSDSEFRFTFVNERLCEMLSYSQEELLGQRIADFVTKDDMPMLQQKHIDRQGGLVDRYELVFISKNGQQVTTIISPKGLFDSSGNFIGSFAVVTDITQLKQAEQQLRAANELKTNFIRVAGHELRTPLSYLLGTARLVKDSHDPDRLAQAIQHMDSRAKRMSDIVQSMFKLMPDLAGAVEIHYSRVNIRELLESIKSDYESYLLQRDQQLIIEISPDTVEFEADTEKLRDMLENLLTNAIKFTPDGGQVHITVSPGGHGKLSFAVTDQGGGIPEADLPYIFEPFFTGKDVMQHSTGLIGYKKRGMGLGLAIVKQFVEMHGGTVSVESTPTGSTVEIKLPTKPVDRDSLRGTSQGAGDDLN